MTDARPITFSAPMIRALLAGRKTQTRRVLKHPKDGSGWYRHPETGKIVNSMGGPLPRIPYALGDRLWVREGFAIHMNAEPRVYPKGDGHPWGSPIFKATFGGGLAPACEGFSPWKLPRHMPRWASRLTLIVESVKVERLQDISYEDAIAEGMCDYAAFCEHFSPGEINTAGETADATARRLRWPQRAFSNLWRTIKGPGSWEENPWVAAIEFSVRAANIDAAPARHARTCSHDQ